MRAWEVLLTERRSAPPSMPTSVTVCAVEATERAAAWLVASVELGGMRTLAAELRMLEAKVQSEVMRQWVRETALHSEDEDRD